MTSKNLALKSWFFTVVLVSCLAIAFSMVFLLSRIDWIIHHELYNYGLQFSLEWASDYWTTLNIIHALLAILTILSLAYFGITYYYRKDIYTEKTPGAEKEAKSLPSRIISLAFTAPGALALIFSIMNNSSVLAFIGLGLTFWGGLFFFASPVKYVKRSLLDFTATSTYNTLDRIIGNLKLESKSYYIPPYPKDAYLPEHLKGLKEAVVFVSNTDKMPSIEELAQNKFLIENPKGICVSPPGLGLLTKIEKELGTDTSKLQLSELCESLQTLITANLQLAKDAEIKEANGKIHLRLHDPAYKSLYNPEENLKSIHFLGCPLVSAIACAISKSTGKTIIIQKENIKQTGKTLDVWLQIKEDRQ